MLPHGRKRFFSAMRRRSSKCPQNGSPTTRFRAGFLATAGKLRSVSASTLVSTHDQQTLSLQRRAMHDYVERRGWTIAIEVKEVGSGASVRELRQKLIEAARRRDIDVVIVWAARYCTSQKSCADSCLCTAAAGLLFPC